MLRPGSPAAPTRAPLDRHRSLRPARCPAAEESAAKSLSSPNATGPNEILSPPLEEPFDDRSLDHCRFHKMHLSRRRARFSNADYQSDHVKPRVHNRRAVLPTQSERSMTARNYVDARLSSLGGLHRLARAASINNSPGPRS